MKSKITHLALLYIIAVGSASGSFVNIDYSRLKLANRYQYLLSAVIGGVLGYRSYQDGYRREGEQLRTDINLLETFEKYYREQYDISIHCPRDQAKQIEAAKFEGTMLQIDKGENDPIDKFILSVRDRDCIWEKFNYLRTLDSGAVTTQLRLSYFLSGNLHKNLPDCLKNTLWKDTIEPVYQGLCVFKDQNKFKQINAYQKKQNDTALQGAMALSGALVGMALLCVGKRAVVPFASYMHQRFNVSSCMSQLLRVR